MRYRTTVQKNSPPMDEPQPSPGPWSFHDFLYGFRSVVVDAEGRFIAANLSRANGRRIAAAPSMAEKLKRLDQSGGQHDAESQEGFPEAQRP